jgi:hypothetical protein
MREEHFIAAGRWRIRFEEERPLPILFRRREEPPRVPPSDRGLRTLLHALELLARRGTGGRAWAAPFREDPIAFLLDTMSDAVTLRGSGGEILHENRAAAELGLTRSVAPTLVDAPMEQFVTGGKRFELRSMRCGEPGAEYFIEIIREVPPLQLRT